MQAHEIECIVFFIYLYELNRFKCYENEQMIQTLLNIDGVNKFTHLHIPALKNVYKIGHIREKK